LTTTPPCGCAESRAWKARALAAELSMRVARRSLERLLENFDRVLSTLPGEDVVTLEDGVAWQTLEPDEPLSPAVWRRVGNWMAERLAASAKEQR
jgi:hypothetical protein